MTKIVSNIQIPFVAIVLLFTIPFLSFGMDGQIKLTQPVPPDTFPIVINTSGSYVLTSNLVVTDTDTNAITIEANDVTLDLNGHTIQGPNTGQGSGISALERFNISIKNGKLWGFWRGIELVHTTADPSLRGAGHHLEGIQVANNNYTGITIMAGLVTNCIANNNVEGISARNSTITYCTANNNTNTGISAQHSTVSTCTANYNGTGIYVLSRSRIEGNNLRNNALHGIQLYNHALQIYVIRNVAGDNGSNFTFGVPQLNDNYMPIWPSSDVNANYGF